MLATPISSIETEFHDITTGFYRSIATAAQGIRRCFGLRQGQALTDEHLKVLLRLTEGHPDRMLTKHAYVMWEALKSAGYVQG